MDYLRKVMCKNSLIRTYKASQGHFYNYWDRRPNPKNQTFEGVIIGKRILSNGANYYRNDSGVVYVPKEYITSYLVSVNMKENPVYVLEEDIEEIE